MIEWATGWIDPAFLTASSFKALLGIYGALSFATLCTFILIVAKPKKDYRELRLRIQSWWVMIVILSGALLGSRNAIFFFAFVSFLALKEYLSLISTRRADRRVLFWAYLSLPLQYYFIYIEWYSMFLVFVPVYVFLFLPFRMVIIGETRDFLRAVSTIQWGLMLTVFAVSHLASLAVLPSSLNPGGGGAGLLLYLIILTELNDVAQFLWGKSLGKHKVIPKVSPNKTVEGLIGGVCTTTLVSLFLAPALTPIQTTSHALAFGLLIGTAGFVGDVVVSALKRDLGIKDTGNILPGHGGILDRIDSLTYTAPLFFHVLKWLYT
jgi:phosphatidate cytidylyltransferase